MEIYKSIRVAQLAATMRSNVVKENAVNGAAAVDVIAPPKVVVHPLTPQSADAPPLGPWSAPTEIPADFGRPNVDIAELVPTLSAVRQLYTPRQAVSSTANQFHGSTNDDQDSILDGDDVDLDYSQATDTPVVQVEADVIDEGGVAPQYQAGIETNDVGSHATNNIGGGNQQIRSTGLDAIA